MGKTSKKTIEKYMAMVSTPGRVWTEQEIISFRSLLNTKLTLDDDIKYMLVDRFNKSLEIAPFQLTKEQQSKGLQWLIKTQINKKGELRAAQTTFIGQDELAMIRDFECFEFVGLTDLSNIYQSGNGYSQFTPEYRLCSNKKGCFTYRMSQDGRYQVIG